MKSLAILVHGVVAAQLLVSPAMAQETIAVAPPQAPQSNQLDLDAHLKVVGPLQLSEGLVDIRNDSIVVLSDPADNVKDAELTGKILSLRSANDSAGKSVCEGVAFFTGGFSLSAIDNPLAQEWITTTSGVDYRGKIMDATAQQVRIKTAAGIKSIPTQQIVQVKSPRAFQFVLPLVEAQAPPAAASAPTPLITFTPTLVPTAASTMLAARVKSVPDQLNERHVKKRLLTGATASAIFGACVALPLGIAYTCPRPHN